MPSSAESFQTIVQSYGSMSPTAFGAVTAGVFLSLLDQLPEDGDLVRVECFRHLPLRLLPAQTPDGVVLQHVQFDGDPGGAVQCDAGAVCGGG